MSYTVKNFKTKKALKDALKAGETLEVFEPSGRPAATDGTVYLEGPHYPAPHTWYAEATLKDGKIVKVR